MSSITSEIKRIQATIVADNKRTQIAVENDKDWPNRETTKREIRILRKWLDKEWRKIGIVFPNSIKI